MRIDLSREQLVVLLSWVSHVRDETLYFLFFVDAFSLIEQKSDLLRS